VAEATRAVGGAALEIRDLRVRYFGRDEDALRDVSVAVEAGSFVTLAGPNGAGKSTLALAAAGLMPRIVRAEVSGSVIIDGEVVVDPTARAEAGRAAARDSHRAGIVFPTPANQLSGTKTSVREELAFGLENLGVPRNLMDARIDEVLSALGIAHLVERPPYALSGGEQQRVAIASIVVMGLPVLVLDEPTAQLDPLATITVADLLVRLAADGIAVLAAEHAPDVLGRSDRTLLLANGAAVADDLPGRALSPGSARLAGIPSPTIVELASAAGLDPGLAFDEAAVAAALGASGGRDRERSVGYPLPAVTWEAVRAQPRAAIEVVDLVHRYPSGLEAVRGVSLAIPPGQTVAIVGQNGSGKTTLVKHLNGLLRPSAGRVDIAGLDLRTRPVHRNAETIGFVFQDPDDQLFSRTVERELRFGPRNLGLDPSATERLVEAALGAIGLGSERGTNPYDLNVSARKLVALGTVLATDPAILVLDEPTTGQDWPGVRRVGAIVDAYRAVGRTVVAITHDMEFAARHFERIVVMREGQIVADASPREVFAAGQAALLASTGLRPPTAARIATRIGLPDVPVDALELLSGLASRRRGEAARP
jgi:energy-coupling factor transporter ATP-binding protein EcfA2